MMTAKILIDIVKAMASHDIVIIPNFIKTTAMNKMLNSQ